MVTSIKNYFFFFQALIKSALDIENKICIKNRITVKFQKFNFIYLNL